MIICAGNFSLTTILGLCFLWFGLFCTSAYAKQPGSPGDTFGDLGPEQIKRTGLKRPKLPEEKFSPPSPEFILPPVPEPPKEEGEISFAPRVFVNRFTFDGNTVFSDKELAKVTEPYEKREITNEELQEVRHKLSLYYVNKGYINSGIVIPDQKVEDDAVTLRVIEGRLAQVEVSGNKRLRSRYIRKRILRGAGPPLNINHLQERLRLIHQNPLIQRIKAEIRPGIRLGEADLKADVVESSPYRFGFQFSNHRSPSVGALELEVHAAHDNLTGWGDSLGIEYGFTEGMDEFSGYYILPLNARETALKLGFKKNDALVIEEPFDEIDINSEADTYEIAFSHPFFKAPGRTFSLSLAGEKRHSETFLGPVGPFSFSPGVQNGESDVTVIRFSQDGLLRSPSRVFAFRSVFSLGIDALGATRKQKDSDPDGCFFAWLGQIQWAGRLNKFLNKLGGSQLIFRTDLQLAADPLLPLEKFAVGGASSVRGYRENQLVKDNGIVSSLELRIPVLRFPLPNLSKGPEDGRVELAPFADWGQAWSTDSPTSDNRSISSVGIGIRWEPSSRILGQIYWGIPLRDVDNPDNDLQDAGIHFELSCRFF